MTLEGTDPDGQPYKMRLCPMGDQLPGELLDQHAAQWPICACGKARFEAASHSQCESCEQNVRSTVENLREGLQKFFRGSEMYDRELLDPADVVKAEQLWQKAGELGTCQEAIAALKALAPITGKIPAAQAAAEGWKALADNAIMEHFSKCPLCGQEFRGSCAIQAYEDDPERHSRSPRYPAPNYTGGKVEDKILRRLITAEGLIVAEVRVCRQGQHHNHRGLHDGDVYVDAERWSDRRGWWNGKTAITSVSVVDMTPFFAPSGASEGKHTAAGPAPTPEPTGVFTHVEGRDFLCPWGHRVTLGRATYRDVYMQGQPAPIVCDICDPHRHGTVQK